MISLSTTHGSNQSQASTQATATGAARSSMLPPSGKSSDSPLKNASPNKLRYKLAVPNAGAKGASAPGNHFNLAIPGANNTTGQISSATSSIQYSAQNQMNQLNLMNGPSNPLFQHNKTTSLGSGALQNMLNPRLRSPNPVSSTAK